MKEDKREKDRSVVICLYKCGATQMVKVTVISNIKKIIEDKILPEKWRFYVLAGNENYPFYWHS